MHNLWLRTISNWKLLVNIICRTVIFMCNFFMRLLMPYYKWIQLSWTNQFGLLWNLERRAWRLGTASKQIGQLRKRINVERLLVYINPVARSGTIYVLIYGYGATSVGSRPPWSADVFPGRKAAPYWWLATTMRRTLLVCLRHKKKKTSGPPSVVYRPQS